MEILNVRALSVGYVVNGYITVLPTDIDYAQVMEWVNSGKEVTPAHTPSEIAEINATKVYQDKWASVKSQWDALTVTTGALHTFAANEEAMKLMDFKANNMGSNAVILWVEDWASFNTNIVELKEALNLAADAHQVIFNSVFGV